MSTSSPGLALAAGLFNGSYPIFLKRPAVLAARVPPLFFQSAKSSCCCLLGVCLVLLRLARSGEPFLFTWWAVASAAAWIPAGLCTIAAVPRLGVGPVMLTSAGTGTLASFLAGSLALGERLKVHTLDGGGTFLLAPAYLAGVLLGMAGLIFAPRLSLQRATQHPSARLVLAEEEGEADSEALHSPRRADAEGVPVMTGLPVVPGRPTERSDQSGGLRTASPGSETSSEDGGRDDPNRALSSRGEVRRGSGAPLPPFDRVGYALAAAAGVFASVQYVMVTLAQRYLPPKAPELEPLGSWTCSFGLGAIAITAALSAAASATGMCGGAPLPPPRRSEVLRAAVLPGLGAGFCWTAGNLLSTLAVEVGGNAVTVAQFQASNLVTSGAWSLLFYREFSGRAAAVWAAAAAFTMAMVVLLGFEKVKE